MMEYRETCPRMLVKNFSLSVSSESLISGSRSSKEYCEFPQCSFSVSSNNDSREIEFIKQQMQEITESLSFKLGKLKKNSAEILEMYIKETLESNNTLISRDDSPGFIDDYEVEVTAQEKDIGGLKTLSKNIEELQEKVQKTCNEIETEKKQLKFYSDEYEKLKNRLNDISFRLNSPTPTEHRKNEYCRCSTF